MSFFRGKFKAAIFDLDGVIVDSEPIHMDVMNNICSQWGRPRTWEEYKLSIGKNDERIWTELKERYNIDLDVQELIGIYNVSLTEYFTTAKDIPIVKDVDTLLEVIRHEEILCAIGSASSRTNIELVLNHVRGKDLFKAIASGDDVRNGKPSPDIFLLAARMLNIDAHECVVIEDSACGVQAALRAGMYCVGFNNPTSGDQDLTQANMVVNSMAEFI